MLDYHIILALEAMLPSYLGSSGLPAFKVLFDGEGVTDAVLTEWWNGLRPVSADGAVKLPEVRAFGAKATPGERAIYVSLLGEQPDSTPLGGTGDKKDANGAAIEQLDLDMTARLSIWGGTAEMTRALHVVVRAIILGTRRNFVSNTAPYSTFVYQGADAPTPLEEQIAEDFGVVIRAVTVAAKRRVSVPQVGPIPALKTWFVLASDLGGGAIIG